MKRTILSVGSVAVALIAISGAWGVGERIVETHRPWATREIETVVAGLQLQAEQFTLKSVQDRIFQVKFEISRNPSSQFLRDELRRLEIEQIKIQRRIDEQIKMERRR